jgi:uncharacterized protein with PQ loop repeat
VTLTEKHIDTLGWLASLMAVLMFSSYIDQIRLNLSGQPGSLLLPLTTVVNCSVWMAYGWLKEHKDWPLLFCNAIGVVVAVLALTTAVTAA